MLFGVPYLFHSMYDGLGGSCSNFHFGRRAALTLKVLKRLSSFLDEKFRAPLILKVGWNCLDEQCFVRIADTICVASISRALGACGFSMFLVGAPARFARAYECPKKPLPGSAVMCTLRFGGSVLGHWSVKDAGDVETFISRMVLAGLVKYLWVVPL